MEGLNGRAENEQEIQDLGALQQEREYTIWEQVKPDSLLFWARFLEPQGVPPTKHDSS